MFESDIQNGFESANHTRRLNLSFYIVDQALVRGFYLNPVKDLSSFSTGIYLKNSPFKVPNPSIINYCTSGYFCTNGSNNPFGLNKTMSISIMGKSFLEFFFVLSSSAMAIFSVQGLEKKPGCLFCLSLFVFFSLYRKTKNPFSKINPVVS